MSHWALLGILPTRDKGAIRRAYAQRLKRLRLDHETDAFQDLREAREHALREADAPEASKPKILYIEPDDGAEQAGATKADPLIGPRLRVVETDLLDYEPPERPLLDDGAAAAEQLADIEARLTACLAVLETPDVSVDMAALDAMLDALVDLPRRSRVAAERFYLRQLAVRLKRSDGTFDPARALKVKPLLVAAGAALGWSFSDEFIRETLEPRDAGSIVLMLDARDGDTQRPLAARLRRFDAHVLLEDSPRLFSAWKAVVAGGALPWRLDPWCVPAPYLWALYRRYWALSLAWYLAAAGASALAFVPRAPPKAVVVASILLTVFICLAGGLLADRMVFFQAWRIARKADRRGLFDLADRKVYLRKRNAKARGGLVFYFVFVSFWVSMFPYFGLVRVLHIVP